MNVRQARFDIVLERADRINDASPTEIQCAARPALSVCRKKYNWIVPDEIN